MDAKWDLYRIPAEEGESMRLTNFDGPDFNPSVNMSSGEMFWSSTENHLGHNADGDFDIYVYVVP